MNPLRRYPDWPRRLSDFIESREGACFDWGSNDCGRFAADAVLAITGEDVIAGARGQWKTAAGARRSVNRRGGLVAWVTSLLGPPVPVAFAHRGDVVLLPSEIVVGQWPGALAVCIGGTCAFPGFSRLGQRPMGDATLCWRVGVT